MTSMPSSPLNSAFMPFRGRASISSIRWLPGYSAWLMRDEGEMLAMVMMLVVDEAQLLNISIVAERQRAVWAACCWSTFSMWRAVKVRCGCFLKSALRTIQALPSIDATVLPRSAGGLTTIRRSKGAAALVLAKDL